MNTAHHEASPWTPFMYEALKVAEQGRWHTAPNPVVGAVLVYEDTVVARGCHTQYGAPHAEIACLQNAKEQGVDPKNCTLHVTLEPCNHHGKTPPCTEAIINAGIQRVVVGMRDPNPLACGGIERLQAAGIEVISGVAKQACHDSLHDFLTWQTSPYPFVMLKMASTLDGRIATRTGHSQWISSKASRREVHILRSHCGQTVQTGHGDHALPPEHVGHTLPQGAVLIGGKTLQADDPLLNARDVPVRQQPLAVCLTSTLPDSCKLIEQRPHETVFFVPETLATSPKAKTLKALGIRIEPVPSWGDRQALCYMLACLRARYACYYVLCEGGARLGLSLLDAGLVGRFFLHIAPIILGDNEATPLFTGHEPQTLADALPVRFISTRLHDGGDIHVECIPNNTLIRI